MGLEPGRWLIECTRCSPRPDSEHLARCPLSTCPAQPGTHHGCHVIPGLLLAVSAG